MDKIIKYSDPENFDKLSLFRENPSAAKLLTLRGIDTDEKVDLFLHPEKIPEIPFSVFKDAEKTLKRIISAVDNTERIIIYGDFDTDGVSASVIMFKVLKLAGANVGYYIPDRDSESHGLNSAALLRLISKEKAKLIITVDCGSSDTKEIALANTFKTDIIITDHHETPDILPPAYSIINPKAPGALSENLSASDIENLCNLAGAGVAFKLGVEILKHFGKSDFVKELLPVVALGTIGDIVPLIGENRRIAYLGIKAVKEKVNPGLTKLFESAGVKDFDKITSGTLAYTAVPRINATGRLADADKAFLLLTCENDEELTLIAKELGELNKLRQSLCEEAFLRAASQVEKNPEQYKDIIFLRDDNAHVGIIGIVASRLVEEYNVPAFVLRKDENIFRCSCRSTEDVNVHKVLCDNAQYFIGFGGHSAAGGFSFDELQFSFEKVRTGLIESVIAQTGGQPREPFINIDFELLPEEVDFKLIEAVNMLEPCGAGNPHPLFVISSVVVEDVRFMGSEKNHLKLFCKSNGITFECIKWNEKSFPCEKGDTLMPVFCPEVNVFNGRTSIQLLLEYYKVQNLKTPKNNSETKFKLVDGRHEREYSDKLRDFVNETKSTVKIFADKKTMNEKLLHFPELISKCVSASAEIPAGCYIFILDCPGTPELFEKIVRTEPKTIHFLGCNVEPLFAEKTIGKIAGMLRYCTAKKNGKTTIKELADAASVSQNIIKTGLSVLNNAGVAEVIINDNNEAKVKFNSSLPFPELKKNKYFKTFASAIETENAFINGVKNMPFDELKTFLIKLSEKSEKTGS